MTSSNRGRDRRAKRTPTSGFLYDRFIPALLIVMGIALAAVIILSVLAMLRLFS